MKKKVIFVTNVFDDAKNGPAMYAQYLWNEFKDHQDIEFHLVAPNILERHPRLYSAGTSSISFVQYKKINDFVAKLATENQDAIIHANASHSVAGLLKFSNRLVVQVNDYESATIYRNFFHVIKNAGMRCFISLLWKNWQERKILRNASRVICNSTYTLSKIYEIYGLEYTKCQVIHKAVDVLAFKKPDSLPSNGIQELNDGMRFVFVGSDWARKGLDVLIISLATVVSSYPDTTLTIVGNPDNKISKFYKNLASQAGVIDNITFAGHKSRQALAILLWQSDCFVLPSRQEALGIAILEAMAAGLPVIATNVGGIPEIIIDDTYGLLVDSNNPAALSDVMIRMIEDVNKRTSLETQSKTSAERFSVDVMTKKVLQLYASVDA